MLVGAIVGAFIDQNARRSLRDMERTLENRAAEHQAKAAMATELYRLLAENATDMISTHHPNGSFDYVTPSWAEFIGLSPGDIIGHLPVEFAHPDDVALLVADHTRGLGSSEIVTTSWRCRHRDGYAWLETTTRSVRDSTGLVKTFVCATRDVTQRTEMKEQLARSEARFRAAADGSFDAFFVLEAVRDEHGEIIDFTYSELNVRGETLLGRTRADVLGRRMSAVTPKTGRNDHREAGARRRIGIPAPGRDRVCAGLSSRSLAPSPDRFSGRRRRRHVARRDRPQER